MRKALPHNVAIVVVITIIIFNVSDLNIERLVERTKCLLRIDMNLN